MSDGVTNKDLYDAIRDLRNEMTGRFDKIETRTSALEAFQNRAIGIWIIASIFLSGIINIVWDKLSGKSQ